jgi:dihydropteroate synthase-like protein
MAKEHPTIWLITGELAEKSLSGMIAKFPSVKVVVAPVTVASFLTVANVKNLVADHPAMASGVIVLPGMIRWNLAQLEDELGAIIVKGPRNAVELHQFINGVVAITKSHAGAPRQELSRLIGALKRTGEQEREGYQAVLQERAALFDAAASPPPAVQHEENRLALPQLRVPGRNFRIAGSKFVIGKDFPPAIMAEIINAVGKPAAEIDEQVGYFLASGADIIDVGATPGKQDPEALAAIVGTIKERWRCIVSIDSLDEKEILAAVDRGASIVLSIDEGNVGILPSLDAGTALVIIPTNVKAGTFPRSPAERVDALTRVIKRARELGFTRLVADPILNSPIVPGLVESLEAFTAFSRAAKDDPDLDVPLFIGGSNVTEMIDTDSTGVNALLAVIGIELGAGILFTTEDSAKCIGSVKDLRAARDLAFHARLKGVQPKDLSFDAFNVKKKHKTIPAFDIPAEGTAPGATIIDADAPGAARPFRPDPSGTYFKFMVDHARGRIFAAAFTNGGLVHVFQGRAAESIGKEILARYNNLTQSHILYIGRELARAEDCLVHSAVYVQDEA